VASPGARCAADYIAARFGELGLEPAGMDGTFVQTFPVRVGSVVASGNELGISGKSYETGKGWQPYGFSGSGAARGPLAWGGEALARPAPPAEGDAPDPAAPDELAGTIVVLEGRTTGAAPGSLAADPHFKASVAQTRGAAAVMILLAPGDALPEAADERRPFLRIPVVAVAPEHADEVRAAARAGEQAELVAALEPRMAEARNVVALLPGSDPARSAEVVVVGAHFDHLGRGGAGSLAPDSHEIHNGADDNASGTAALVEAARRLAGGPPPSRPVLFIAFSGEERGLLGSAHFVAEPTVPLERAVAMINMDMVGRLRDNTLTVYGMATAAEWETIVAEANAAGPEAFTLSLLPDGFGPSDHSSFYGRGIPVLHFFTNTHTEYHRPEDDWDTINGEGLDRIAALVADVTARLAGTPERTALALTAQAGAGEPPAAGAAEASSGRGYGPYFGSIPDMSPVDYGVRLSGVREDSPAERAGLRAGDVLVRFGGAEVSDLYAFTYALRDRKPGDRVEVVVERDGRRITMYAVLGERR
jgi:hypothetical protein